MYKHEMATRDEDKQLCADMLAKYPPRANSPAPASANKDAKGKACPQWQNGGTCSFGDRCKFSHATPAAPATTKKKQKKGKQGGADATDDDGK